MNCCIPHRFPSPPRTSNSWPFSRVVAHSSRPAIRQRRRSIAVPRLSQGSGGPENHLHASVPYIRGEDEKVNMSVTRHVPSRRPTGIKECRRVYSPEP
jgi:hypothetical protein